MKKYSNGHRPQKMYGGGMTSPRKPMQMGGLAEKNREQTTMTAPKKDPMGMMTQEKKFGMGYNLGGAIAKFEGRQKKALGGKNAKPDYLDFDNDGNKTESMKKALRDKKGKSKA